MYVWVLLCCKTYCICTEIDLCALFSPNYETNFGTLLLGMLCISICDKAGLLSEKCKRCVTNLSHLPSVGDCHEDENDRDGNEEDCICKVVVTIMKRFLG